MLFVIDDVCGSVCAIQLNREQTSRGFYINTVITKRGSQNKNAALIWTLSKTGVTLAPPPEFWIFWDTFPKVKTFGTLGKFLWILIHPIFWQKVSGNFFDLVKSPPLSKKNSKKVGPQKVSQFFLVCLEGP